MNNKDIIKVKKKIENLPNTNFLTSSNIDNILEKSIFVISNTDELFIESGDKIKGVYIILDGEALVSAYSSDGKRVLIDKLKNGALIGDIEYYSDVNYSIHNIEIVSTCEFLLVPIEVVDEILINDIEFSNYVNQQFANKLLKISKNYSHVLVMTAKDKLVQLIINRYYQNNSVVVKSTIEELSEYLGMSPRHIRRMLQEIENEGLIKRGRSTIVIEEISLLENYLL